jgi:hypothetical protein
MVWLAICIALAALSACGRPSPVERKWTEDVQLDDGSTVELQRTVKLRVSNSLSGDAYNAEELDATLSFLGALQGLPTWSAPRMPLVLYRDESTKEWVIVATTTSCEVWRQAGKPKPDYWEYRLMGREWKRFRYRVPQSVA